REIPVWERAKMWKEAEALWNQIKGRTRRRILRNAGIIPVKDMPIYCFNCADRPARHMVKSGDGALLCENCHYHHLAAYNKEWRQHNPEYMKAWRKAHPEYKDRTAAERMRRLR